MTPPRLTAHRLRGAAASTLISALFALAWGLNGSAALPGGWRTATAALVVLVTLALVAAAAVFNRRARRAPPDPAATRNPFRTVSYRVAVVAILVAIPVAGRVLTLAGQGDAVMPVVAVIVGLHFVGLVRAFESRAFAWVAGAFCVLELGALFLPVRVGETLALRHAVVGLGCALVLWLSLVPLLVATARQLADSSA